MTIRDTLLPVDQVVSALPVLSSVPLLKAPATLHGHKAIPGGHPGTPFILATPVSTGTENVSTSSALITWERSRTSTLHLPAAHLLQGPFEGSTGPVNSGRLSQDGTPGAAAAPQPSWQGARGWNPHARGASRRAGGARRRLKGPRDLETGWRSR